MMEHDGMMMMMQHHESDNSHFIVDSSSGQATFSMDTFNRHFYSQKYEAKLNKQLRLAYTEAEEESLSGKFCIPYFTCAVDPETLKRVFKACSHILKKEHLEKSGLL